MIKYINGALRGVVFWYWVIKATIRQVRGRWYYFRDMPQWVLDDIMEAGPPPSNAKDELFAFYYEARAETMRRALRES